MNTNVAAKRILIYGDSYTFGKDPGGNRLLGKALAQFIKEVL